MTRCLLCGWPTKGGACDHPGGQTRVKVDPGVAWPFTLPPALGRLLAAGFGDDDADSEAPAEDSHRGAA